MLNKNYTKYLYFNSKGPVFMSHTLKSIKVGDRINIAAYFSVNQQKKTQFLRRGIQEE